MTRATIVLATSNPGKLREIRKYFAGLPIRILPLEAVKPQTLFPETAETFRENARGKSLFYSRYSRRLTLAEDSGIEIESLGGEPGVRSARYSGVGATDEKNIRKVLRRLKGVPMKRRKAQFVSHLVLTREGCVIKETNGRVRGFVAPKKRGAMGFGYDPIFYYPRFRRTFGEIDPAKKNTVSHRGRALKKMKRFLLEYLK